ncbi:LysR family transcriptional regulator [Leifsonia shinshuensis]|uniref:LysR family transcriptional regulator n=1 Tax=Leifsonia shinshuensis TaxID=150026 RepID=UPI001F5095B5|nr:LysR family transcriptional regulator [Leifsonia shinshuensis]MCI0158965.1 LysR family transcriptional regulator [Leifsonia shinshuensis]
MTPSILSLRLLVQTVERGSVSQAAHAVGLSQQAASARLAALERELGTALMVRSSHGTRPTEAGALVAEWAAEVLDAADRFDASVLSLRESSHGSLRIAASMTIAENLAPRWLTAMHAESPELLIELTAANSEAVAAAVRSGAAAVGFIETPELPAGLEHATFGSDELVVVVGRDHPWAGRARGVSIEELARTPVVARESGSGTRLAYERAASSAGHPPVRPALELSSTSAIRATAAAGDHPAVLSILAVREQLAAETLVKVPVRQLRIIRPLTAVWRRSNAGLPGAVRRLLEVVGAGV